MVRINFAVSVAMKQTPTADVAVAVVEAAGDKIAASARVERPERAEKRKRRRK